MRDRAAAGGSPEFLYGPYSQTCPGCGAKGIPADFRYCGLCGRELAVAPEPVAAGATGHNGPS